ncbi:ciliary microtubule-associated protein 2-like [Periplaneta americana]|uniref:ciliary microtubule-associated protein 2-like n=1 Tax=Periplaneta americana TaxID=6978 RepID=UPI0037E72BEC
MPGKTFLAVKTSAFGVAARRFKGLGIHPKLETTGCLRKHPNISPATYYPNTSYLKKHVGTRDWRLEKELEEFSKTAASKVVRLSEKRSRYSDGGGPAVQNLPDFLVINSRRPGSVFLNVGFGTGRRFSVSSEKQTTPGPGAFGNPEQKYYESTHIGRKGTYLPSFEWDGFLDRSHRPRKGLAPNRYILKDPDSIEERVKRSVSRRGPYDCFTGPRDGTTIKNHFAPPLHKDIQSWPCSLPSEMDRLKRKEHATYGKWVKAKKGNRLNYIPSSRIMVSSLTGCRKDPNSPSPWHYDVKIPDFKVESVKNPPFNSMVDARPFKLFEIQPAPGRYRPRRPRKHVNAHTNVFRSRTPRTLSLVKPTLNAF